ncbi:MAG: fatty-acid--CoA ligase [Actinomycetia bacterium]|nr:fatty-acid--CoA ligase [Actinomycetes bacterium]MCH9701947.1 fatty-acid--CoA ligase [Actinomycetes bacterium]MCH9761021.1 fatty-acid--CoA ligase [Actinomycetes bacterium]
MGDDDLQSFILACDFHADDVDHMWEWLNKHRDGLSLMGAHHVVLYESIWEPCRVLVTIGIRHAHSIRDVLRSPAIFEWFNVSGADDIPPIFGGEVVEKIDLEAPTSERKIGRVTIGVMSSVEDVAALMIKVHDGLERFRRGGVRKIWVYRALDDGNEVLILQEIADEASARRWIERPDAAAEWITNAGLGAYPTRFVGKFAHLLNVTEQG